MDRSDSPRAWFEREPQRLHQDIDDMFWHFPLFTYTIKDNMIIWQGAVQILTPKEKFQEHELRIWCCGNYPQTAPRVYRKGGFPPSGRWRPPHLYSDDSLCLFYPEDEPCRRWTKEDKLSTAVAWACEWLHAYEYWRRTKRWPGRQAPHRKRAKKKKV